MWVWFRTPPNILNMRARWVARTAARFYHSKFETNPPWLLFSPVRSQAQSGIHPQCHWSPCAFTGMHLPPCFPLGSLCLHRDAPSDKPPIKIISGPLNLSPPSRVLWFYTVYHTRDSTAQRVCSPGAGFIFRNFCRLVAYLCRVVSLCQ